MQTMGPNQRSSCCATVSLCTNLGIHSPKALKAFVVEVVFLGCDHVGAHCGPPAGVEADLENRQLVSSTSRAGILISASRTGEGKQSRSCYYLKSGVPCQDTWFGHAP